MIITYEDEHPIASYSDAILYNAIHIKFKFIK